MSKYLNKSEEQLQKELAEIQQALEQKERLQQAALGAVFSRFLKSIDEPKAAKYHLNIIEKNADKAEKKALKVLMNTLKSVRDSEFLDNNLQDNTEVNSQNISSINQNSSSYEVVNGLNNLNINSDISHNH